MDNFIQITVFCPPEPRIGAFVYRNAGKVYRTLFQPFLGIVISRLPRLLLQRLSTWNILVKNRMVAVALR